MVTLNIARVRAVYFSPTGTTGKIVTRIADTIATELALASERFDFTLPNARSAAPSFAADELVVFGTPVYAGRVPNVLLKYLDTVEGNGALVVPVVLFGNRNYDDALIELKDVLERRGLHTVAAAAFVGEHAFSYTLAAGRPDETDVTFADNFARRVVTRLKTIDEGHSPAPVQVKGVPHPYRGYFLPRDTQGNPVDMRKVKPVTGPACTDCKICVAVCPMGSISYDDVREYTGICIRCGACVKKCPQQARYYEDESYLYHKRELEEGLTRRAEPEVFF